ncbi:50S ribosomal protein L5 [bacterium K02(2017)]|nr:50S ribosomal protein L5 [bacterium K02(2017)]
MYLQEKYKKEIAGKLHKELELKNVMLTPRLNKIVVNSSTSEAVQSSKILDGLAKDIEAITGQKPILTKAKKSISNFKLREGQAIGVSVTLRGRSMYEFLNRLINVAMPRIRDFKGYSKKSFDGNGNYSLGLTEHTIFPEINPDKVDHVKGMNICINTSTTNDEHARVLLKELGFPFRT